MWQRRTNIASHHIHRASCPTRSPNTPQMGLDSESENNMRKKNRPRFWVLFLSPASWRWCRCADSASAWRLATVTSMMFPGFSSNLTHLSHSFLLLLSTYVDFIPTPLSRHVSHSEVSGARAGHKAWEKAQSSPLHRVKAMTRNSDVTIQYTALNLLPSARQTHFLWLSSHRCQGS